MPGDNFSVRVVSADKEHLDAAIRIAFSAHRRATHYVGPLPSRDCHECGGSGKQYKRLFGVANSIDSQVVVRCSECDGEGKLPPTEAMILLWADGDRRVEVQPIPLPFPMDCGAAINFLSAWLDTCTYPPEPDQDGSNGKGFIATTGNFWGHCEGLRYSIVMVVPDWQMYGK
jgi:hypothetical protein